MPDIDITAEPGYGDAVKRFNDAKLAAEGDELKTAQAQAAWQTDLSKLTTLAYQRRDSTRETEAARATALTKYPDVDPELYNDTSDPAEIERKAGLLQEAINKHKPAEGAPGGQSWGGTPPAGTTGAPPTAPPKSREERLTELGTTIKRGIREPEANREFKDLTLESMLETLQVAPRK
jgi:hypothetical protein